MMNFYSFVPQVPFMIPKTPVSLGAESKEKFQAAFIFTKFTNSASTRLSN